MEDYTTENEALDNAEEFLDNNAVDRKDRHSVEDLVTEIKARMENGETAQVAVEELNDLIELLSE